MEKNLVSIIMLSHNHKEFVEESVKSVLAQTYTNWELLFYDLGSKDDTVSRMVELKAQDKRIHVSKMVLSESINSCQNAALKEAKGRWIAFLNNGDLWELEKLERQIAFMEQNGYHYSYTNYRRRGHFRTNRVKIQSGPQRLTRNDMALCCWPGNLTVMYDAMKMGRVYVQDLKHNNDYVLWLMLSERADCYLLPECLATLRTPQSTILEYLLADKLEWRYQVYRKVLKKNLLTAICMTFRSLWYASVKRIKYSIVIKIVRPIRRTNWSFFCPSIFNSHAQVLTSGEIQSVASDKISHSRVC